MIVVSKKAKLATFLLGTVVPFANAQAGEINIPAGTLGAALDAYTAQTGIHLLYAEHDVSGVRTKGAAGDLTPDGALTRLLSGTGFIIHKHSPNEIAVVKDIESSTLPSVAQIQIAQASPSRAAVETVTVTSSKLGGADVQSIPIAITALSQEQLTATQTAGGPDLVKQVPNLTFTKTNFTGYSIQIRGIGTQAISVTTDPAVAVAFNDTPFIRNHFFEQEFYDVGQVEVLRGPQGTLYGRNATAGVVNVISAKPTDQFEAMASADIGNYKNRRFEGMINIPVVDDRLDIRAAVEWTKRDGYSFNEITQSAIDGRNLWSGRISVGLRPVNHLQVNLVWEHFQENDDRLRSSKQLCKTAPSPTSVNGVPVAPSTNPFGSNTGYLSQGCLPVSLYSPEAFEVPNGFSLPYVLGLNEGSQINGTLDPYLSKTQSRDLRVIESTLEPIYRAKNDTIELNADYNVAPDLTFTSQTGFNRDFLYSTEDYNRFNTSPGIWSESNNQVRPGLVEPNGDFCDPQLGCSDRLVGLDLSMETAWQLSQEFRLVSNFNGPLNFSIGGNYLHYETDENYYVFINGITMIAAIPAFVPSSPPLVWIPNVSDNMEFLNGTERPDPSAPMRLLLPFSYIDPNPLSSINGQGHNYFRSDNPYTLNSYAAFGEAYYNITPDLKLTGGLRWTGDRKHFVRIPSEVLIEGYGYPTLGSLNQQWDEITGRAAANWTPKLDFTDQTLVYASYAHGYKAGGANPPGAVLNPNPIHPLTFAPEFIDAYEVGTKNTLLDSAVTLNGSAFFYNYKGYQISEIVDRTAINLNFDATVRGAELEASWEPAPGLKFSFAGGYEATRIADGSKAVDLMDRTDIANRPDWMVIKPAATLASNCVVPLYLVGFILKNTSEGNRGSPISGMCGAYATHVDPITGFPYTPNPTGFDSGGNALSPTYDGYPGYDPAAGTPGDPYTGQNSYNGHDYGPAPNNGAGFDKDVGGNELPNAPRFTVSASVDYTIPVTSDWASTFHADYYWQDYSWARVFNSDPYDRLRGYTNVNLALILTSQNGWQVMGYLKNVFNVTDITGAFLNSDDSGLTTNVFLTDPRLFGVRVTKHF